MRVIGGDVNSRLWLQILADICKTDMLLTNIPANSTTSMGVALAAAVGIGVYPALDEAVTQISLTEKISDNQDTRPVYEGLFDTFLKLYPQVKSLF
jgi:sugar (pentulose or hexulose) kinase